MRRGEFTSCGPQGWAASALRANLAQHRRVPSLRGHRDGDTIEVVRRKNASEIEYDEAGVWQDRGDKNQARARSARRRKAESGCEEKIRARVGGIEAEKHAVGQKAGTGHANQTRCVDGASARCDGGEAGCSGRRATRRGSEGPRHSYMSRSGSRFGSMERGTVTERDA
ncbi:MAG: hypothetical protein K0S86_2141 [Geminicoccaceae bacterium]|nr:hypothetical protein [Geminicoccaceae bacterium]